MKSISFILGILMLALALKPCADSFCVDTENDTEICADHICDSEHSQNDSNDNHDDSCVSLCVCNCCGTLVLHQELPVFILNSKTKISTQINSHYESHYRFDMLFVIWQPPQFVS
ncbi:MAG: hypothetical protein AAF611_16955 [Bacteroidota bacterium]